MTKKSQFILSIDQGTTGSRAILFDLQGKIVGSAYQEFRQYFPKPGWVEHDADEIWKSCRNVITSAMAKAKISPSAILSIGITNQRETTVMWDRKSGKPVYRAIVWQCRRTALICAHLKKYGSLFRKKTGLVVDAYFSGTKIKWLLDNVNGLKPKAERGEVCFGTIDTWLIWNLTGRQSHVTDHTNAARTLIFNIKEFQWDTELLKILKIPELILPSVQKSGSTFGKTRGLSFLPDGIPISAVMGDQQAALYGQTCFDAGDIKNTYGTGCFLVLNTGKKILYDEKGLLTTIACDDRGNPVYAVEGSVFIAGAVIQWIRDQLGILKESRLSEKMVQGLTDTGGVYFVPAFTGLGAPYWNSDARGLICGLTRGTSQRHIVRAALESIAYQTKDVFLLMEKCWKHKIKELKVDGGACANNFLMQFQADILNIPLIRPSIVELTAQGAAYLAGVTLGVWTRKDLERFHSIEHRFTPQMKPGEIKDKYDGWLTAVRRTTYL